MAKIGLAIAALIVIIIFTILSLNVKNLGNFNLLNKESTVTINNKVFKVEVAKDQTTRAKGLSGRESLMEEKAMLFLFEKPDYYSFWMKNMQFPLDIIFISKDKIVTVVNNVQPLKEGQDNTILPTEPIDKVLEINAGLAQKYNLKKGDKVTITL
ncbi:MAG: DUF192 domain-containing protein [Candidatus Levybacteria bacterium]|nr:DUF192 domain-containing protein [Candidatus Levybacteria bacterium]